jgi:proteasome lid subunit RPN8/RPN11
MRIPKSVLDEMVDHARQEKPLECCGLLAGKGDLVTRIYRLENDEKSPSAYRAVPEQQLKAFLEIEDLGLDLLATYHSHPETDSYPSRVDIENAYFGGMLTVIVSLNGENPAIQAFWISQKGKITEETIHVV